MEQNLPVVAKKFWNIVRVMFFMLRKGISKRKLMVDLNLMMKRGKIAGKALHNLMFHHSHHWAFSSTSASRRPHLDDLPHPAFSAAPPAGEYEFSCANSPANSPFPFPFTKRKHNGHGHGHHSNFFSCAQTPPTEDHDVAAVHAVMKMLNNYSETASPALPGFGRTPTVRQLRVTDSPFPLRGAEEDNHVDEAAEQFILKFYNDLKRQNGLEA